MARRDTNLKEDVPLALLSQKVALSLVSMQHDLLERARAARDCNMTTVWTWEEFTPAIGEGKLVLTPFCNETEFEAHACSTIPFCYICRALKEPPLSRHLPTSPSIPLPHPLISGHRQGQEQGRGARRHGRGGRGRALRDAGRCKNALHPP